MSQLTVKLKTFEGPLDLLLHLLSKNKIQIYDIPIAEILDQYMEYLYGMYELDMEAAGDFMTMATTLICIKLKMLLPKEKDDIEDPRMQLVEAIIEYKKIKAASADLAERYLNYRDRLNKRPDIVDRDNTYYYVHDVSELINAYMSVVNKNIRSQPPKAESFSPIISTKIISVTVKMRQIFRGVLSKGKIKFLDLLKAASSKSEIIAYFLAVLELSRSTKVTVAYKDNDLIIKKN